MTLIGTSINSTAGRALLVFGLGLSATSCSEILGLDEYSDGQLGGMTGSGGVGGIAVGSGIPSLTFPPDGSLLPPTRSFQSWQAVNVPADKIISSFEICQTTEGLTSIQGAACPGSKLVATAYDVTPLLTPNTTYHWKVRTRYNDDTVSEYSAIRFYSTDDSLLGWWRMDDGTGSTATDSSSAGNNGILTNFDTSTAWVPGLVGGALSFDGTNDFVELGDILNFDATNSFTISAWANRQSVGADHTIFARADYTDPTLQRGYWFGFSSTDTLNFFLVSDSSTGDRLRIDSTTLFNAPNTAHHVAVTYNGSTMAAGAKLFVDGVEDAVTFVSDALAGTTLNPAPARIGGSIDIAGMPLASLYNFEGIIDDVTVYNRSLTAQEIVNETCAREALNRQETNDMSALSPICN